MSVQPKIMSVYYAYELVFIYHFHWAYLSRSIVDKRPGADSESGRLGMYKACRT